MHLSNQSEWESTLDRLMQRNGWGLVSCAELWESIVAEQPTAIHSAAEFDYAVKGCYGTILYNACQATNEPQRREQAFTEIHQYLYRMAKKQRPVEAEDAAQSAIIAIHDKLDQCRDPKAFLTFIYFQLRTTLQAIERKKKRYRSALNQDITDLSELTPGGNIPLPDITVTINDLELTLWECVEAALGRLANEQMRTVILGTYRLGWETEEIAETLGIAGNYVNVLRHRALKKLRADPELIACIQLD